MPLRSSETTAPAVFDGLEHGVARLEFRRTLIPPLPNFPAFNAVIAGAAESALVECLKGDRRGFSVAGPRADFSRSYGSVAEAARESVFVVSLDGRHTRESAIAGYQLGKQVGREAARRVLRELR